MNTVQQSLIGFFSSLRTGSELTQLLVLRIVARTDVSGSGSTHGFRLKLLQAQP
jgi:hypothetical protein